MLIPILTAYLELIRFGFLHQAQEFCGLHSVVRNSSVHKHTYSLVPLWRNCVVRSMLPASGIGKRCFACNVCGRDLFASPPWNTRTTGDRDPANSVQRTCLGGSRRPSRQ